MIKTSSSRTVSAMVTAISYGRVLKTKALHLSMYKLVLLASLEYLRAIILQTSNPYDHLVALEKQKEWAEINY